MAFGTSSLTDRTSRILTAFKARTEKRYSGYNISTADGILRSYRMPIVILLSRKGKDPLYLHNGDKFSNTTTSHQSFAHRHLSGPTCSFSAIAAHFGLGMTDGWVSVPEALESGTLVLLDYTPDSTCCSPEYKARYGYASDPVVKDRPSPAEGWTIWEEEVEVTGSEGVAPSKVIIWHAHRPGCCLFRYSLGTDPAKRRFIYLLCGMDEGSYFCCQMPDRPKTVAAAFSAFMPEDVKAAPAFKRHGEWYFLPDSNPLSVSKNIPGGIEAHIHNNPIKSSKNLRRLDTWMGKQGYKVSKESPLPFEEGAARHVCTRLYTRGKETYVVGRIRHVRPGQPGRPDHKMLTLYDGVLYRVFKNRAIRSTSSNGRVD